MNDASKAGRRRATCAKYRAANKEKIRAQAAIYRATHKEQMTVWRDANAPQIAATKAAHYAENKTEILKRNADWRAKNSDRIAATKAANYVAHKPIILAKHKIYRDNNSEKINAQRALYREQNRDSLRELCRACFKKNRGKYLATQIARQNALTKTLDDSYVRAVLAREYSFMRKRFPQALVEAKRLHLQIHRLIKEKRK